jgi:hypothetical protein
MKIKKNSNLLILEAQKTKAVFPLDVAKYKPDDEHSIILSSATGLKKADKSLLIDNPGEFDASDIFVYALTNEEEKVQLFSVDLEGVNVMVFNSADKILNLLENDELPSNNILVCNINGDYSVVSEVIDELEPNVLILTSKNEELLAEAIKKMSLTPSDTQTYFTFSEDDFSEEASMPMKVVLLK